MPTTSSPSPTLGSIASRWRELQGSGSWEGLLDPLDPDLRASILAYGELTEATYDGFNSQRRSPHAGSCIYGHADLLARAGVSRPGLYAVTKFFYATCGLLLPKITMPPPLLSSTSVPDAFFVLPLPALLEEPWSRESNWMGYVAVATDEGVAALGRRDILVAWRGTVESLEWVNDLDFTPTSAAPVLGPAAEDNGGAVVHHGFLSVYMTSDEDSKYNQASARDQVIEEIRRLMEVHKDEATSITVTGHSLGGSLATLNAVDMVAHGVNVPPPSTSNQPSCPVTAILFASPHVGDDKFRSAFASFPDLRALHVRNYGDVVPLYPPIGYVDSATAVLPIDTGRSPYLKQPGTVQTRHNLECYLHGIAGHQSSAGGFRLVVDRDVALVNKGADALKDEYPVPPNWHVVNNKCMVKGPDGHWKLRDFEET
ncbi:phospholipase A1-II 7 [Lolium perenne]|uniref:phospholipase A1-II 7 n=1 Tax=Lolium perenne TaxID=4522 RepID=UPI0021EA02B9|nr:phospholipase A1-II 7-like [Lolium perenne]